jgi:5'-3' exonuclease
MYYILQMLELLNFYGIRPVMVFDGRSLHRKSGTIEKRNKLKM